MKEQAAEAKKKEGNSLAQFVQAASFDNRALNQVLVMWLIRSAQPWMRIDNAILGISFNYARHGFKLYSCAWAASEAHWLYINLQDQIRNTIQSIKSKVTVIHDVWTTKGKRQAFLGISFTYITNDWTFQVSHLALKYISRTHKGKYLAIPFADMITQTTDSGSNNGTMTAAVDWIILEKTGTDLNLTSNHIRCFCHKVALILTAGTVRKSGLDGCIRVYIGCGHPIQTWARATDHPIQLFWWCGLKSIDLPTKGLTPERHGTLGFVPCLVTIEEDNLEVTDPGTLTADAADEEPIPDAQSDNGSDKDFDAEDKDANTVPVEVTSSKTSEILKKVDLVIKQITSSAARQSKFNSWSKRND
ncbi:hypothetical protein PCANC_19779 [Puccinia coronata f. sp. avenae]|uniref:Uncharacterized protein n=1 Tax=Puccinia coronata f. sp. avenae TaxID=200324 RepID=A0A2N5S9T5_9BASI|nr:hypothetical protein PCANC_19779 [Puccinia coronata f. sp. avenae]